MKVLLKQNVSKLGKIGEVVEVKAGYARNYLLPQGIATEPTLGNLRAIEARKQAYLEELAKEHAELEAKAEHVQRKEITISARANEEGHLYGSIGPAQLAAVLAAENVFVDVENIVLDEPIRQLDKYDVLVRFAEDITATIHVWVVPHHEEGDEVDDDAPPAETDDDATSPDLPAGRAGDRASEDESD